MKIINSILKSNLFFIVAFLFGCVSETYYYAGEPGKDNFVAPDENFKIDPENYPVFVVKVDRKAPQLKSGLPRPIILRKYNWVVTHSVNGRYLMYSVDYNYDLCLLISKRHGWPARRDCEPGRRSGLNNNLYIYIKPDGSAYGWQPLNNPKRAVFKSDKVSWFRIDDSGDWSGQPWFECVERCDKLINMK